MASVATTPLWWDRDHDNSGRPIRPDVRSAAKDMWKEACRQTMYALADTGPAAELMEKSVAQVSRYLDRMGAPSCSRKHGLVFVAFLRALHRCAMKLSRIELVGGPQELAERVCSESWIAQVNARLDFERIIHRLSQRSADALFLRAVGYEWKEIADIFGTTVPSLRNMFWREIKEIRWNS